jgi:hypothetical protein
MFLRNVGSYKSYIVSHPRRWRSFYVEGWSENRRGTYELIFINIFINLLGTKMKIFFQRVAHFWRDKILIQFISN